MIHPRQNNCKPRHILSYYNKQRQKFLNSNKKFFTLMNNDVEAMSFGKLFQTDPESTQFHYSYQ